MAQTITYQTALKFIYEKEMELNCSETPTIKNAFEMIEYLQFILKTLKKTVIQTSFKSTSQEIEFFKNIKPKILGKLIFYNKVYRFESNCPNDTQAAQKYYSKKIHDLHIEYKKHLYNNDFFKYYKTSRTDRDTEYFTLGKVNILSGINSFAFEIDLDFSTYYDYKIARIIAHDLLSDFLNQKTFNNIQEYSISLTWSESQNALIELIYALYLSRSINDGKLELRKISVVFQQIFDINLLDIHHAFHRMKYRAKSKTSYLDKLKEALEEYMNKKH
ncbi:RteC domain-containing protein [Myroides odoratimimus]|uniref:RteC domain-containing protein n=1 Tax=Myroides odoratimimus TaxID=76832 RepID=UPI00257526DC|nr:RteC domain-containing protein [Myroides odoratimimus]MDM1513508.1 RteC domain-containing protein [Myroides odoratimimus]